MSTQILRALALAVGFNLWPTERATGIVGGEDQ